MRPQEIASRASALMPGLLEDLGALVAIPSIAFPGYPAEPVHADGRGDAPTVPGGRLHRRAAHGRARPGTRRSTGRSPGRRGHRWSCSTRTTTCSRRRPSRAGPATRGRPTRKDDGRIYGRGAADDKGGLVTHLGTLRVFDGQAAVHGQADPRGDGGDREQPRGLRRGAPGAVRLRRVRHLRHGQPAGRRAGPDHRAARRRRLRRHRQHARAPAALRGLRRAGARRDDGARPPAGHAARRRGRRRRRRGHVEHLGRARTSAPTTSAPAPTCSTGST